MEPLAQPIAHDRWLARLQLEFVQKGPTTILSANRHLGPLRLQRPFYPEGRVCHAYVLHPPGGVVGGDQLEIAATVKTDATALVTTPGATKFYRTNGKTAVQSQRLIVEGRGSLEWFPQETIFFPGADAALATHVQLAEKAAFIGWEIMSLGLPAGGQAYTCGKVDSTLRIEREGSPMLLDRLRIHTDEDLAGPAGLRKRPVTATFMAVGVEAGLLEALRRTAAQHSGGLAGLTLVDDLLVARYLGESTADARNLFERLWKKLRPKLMGRIACPPRIWST